MRIQYVKSRAAWCVYDKGPTDRWYTLRRYVQFDTQEAAAKYCREWSAQFPNDAITIHEVKA